MFVVHVLSRLLCVTLGLEVVKGILALGLGELVDLGADEASKHLLGESVVDGLAYGTQMNETWVSWWQWRRTRTLSALVVLKLLEAFKGGGAADQLVGELGFMLLATVDLLVSVVGFTCRRKPLLILEFVAI